MWVIQDNLGLYFAGVACGCAIWKGCSTRAMLYQTERGAQKDAHYYCFQDCEIINDDVLDIAYKVYREEG